MADIKEGLLLWFTNVLIKSPQAMVLIRMQMMSVLWTWLRKNLAKELNKPIIRKFNKITVYSGFRDNIWSADLADMQLISKVN